MSDQNYIEPNDEGNLDELAQQAKDEYEGGKTMNIRGFAAQEGVDLNADEKSQPLQARSLGGAFADMLRQSEAEQAGSPFYDKTLNYLFQRVSATNKEAANIRSKISKAESALEDALEENATAQTLFIREYNRRTVVDPKSGEVIPNPFVPEDEETDDDES